MPESWVPVALAGIEAIDCALSSVCLSPSGVLMSGLGATEPAHCTGSSERDNRRSPCFCKSRNMRAHPYLSNCRTFHERMEGAKAAQDRPKSGVSSPPECLFRVKTGKAQHEQMFSALPPRADIAQCSRHVRLVPIVLQKSF